MSVGTVGWALEAVVAAEVVDPQPGLALAAVVVAVAGLAVTGLLAARNRPRRPTAAPATQDLGPEPPAVVDLLVGGFDVDDDAIAATLVDLAARRHVDIEEVAGGNVIVRIRRNPPSEDLAPYEQRVLRHVERHAGPGGEMPAAALSTGPDSVSNRWRKGFTREVTADARGRGLCRRRWGFRDLGIIWAFVVVAGILQGLARAFGEVTYEPGAYGTGGNLMWGLAVASTVGLGFLAVRFSVGDAQRDTDEGLERARHWAGVREWYASGEFHAAPAAAVAVWDRHLAYATAAGCARTVERQLDFGAEHDRKAWSDHTGVWRQVTVRYRVLRPGWGEAPWSAALIGAVRSAILGALLYAAMLLARDDLEGLEELDPEVRQWIGLGALVVAVVLVPLMLLSLVRFACGVADLFPRRTIEGTVVRARTFRTGDWLPGPVQWYLYQARRDQHGNRHERHRRSRHHLAIDDGSTDRIRAFRVRKDRLAPQGATVRVRHSPLLGYVAQVEVLSAPPATEAAVPSELAQQAMGLAGGLVGQLGSRLDGAMAHLETATDEEGRPVLDQVDEDGVTLRERMAEARQHLGRDQPS